MRFLQPARLLAAHIRGPRVFTATVVRPDGRPAQVRLAAGAVSVDGESAGYVTETGAVEGTPPLWRYGGTVMSGVRYPSPQEAALALALHVTGGQAPSEAAPQDVVHIVGRFQHLLDRFGLAIPRAKCGAVLAIEPGRSYPD